MSPRAGAAPERAGGLLRTGNASTRVLVGLGNAERRYALTRHNVGARVVQRVAERLGLRAQEGLVPIPGSRSGLVLPEGFMNESGRVVRRAVERWRPTAEGLLVVHDDLELPLGAVQLKEGGGHGGHNGLRDVMAALGTGAFRRLRLGIGRPAPGVEVADFVLASFRPEEKPAVEAAIAEALEISLRFIGVGGAL